MPRGQAVGIQFARGRQEIPELDPLVAADARDGRRAGQVLVGELVHHRFAEAVLVVEHVVGEAHLLGHAAGIVDVAPGAAGALAGQRGAVIVELQRDSHDVIALFGQLRRDDGTVDATGHGDHDACHFGRLCKAETV